jgi:hypothetical protein
MAGGSASTLHHLSLVVSRKRVLRLLQGEPDSLCQRKNQANLRQLA